MERTPTGATIPPEPGAYRHALGKPGRILDPLLKDYVLNDDESGGGGFGGILQMRPSAGHGPVWAVKFPRVAFYIDETEARYAHLRNWIERVKQIDPLGAPYLVVPVFVREGVLAWNGAHDERVPILRMPWVDGLDLSDWVRLDSVKRTPELLRVAADNLLRLGNELENYQFYHGDLKPGNIRVLEDPRAIREDDRVRLILVDYDRALAPTLVKDGRHIFSAEKGSPNFRYHDESKRVDGKGADRLPLLILRAGLFAIADDPSLADKIDDLNFPVGENDQILRARSPRIQELLRSKDPRAAATAKELVAALDAIAADDGTESATPEPRELCDRLSIPLTPPPWPPLVTHAVPPAPRAPSPTPPVATPTRPSSPGAQHKTPASSTRKPKLPRPAWVALSSGAGIVSATAAIVFFGATGPEAIAAIVAGAGLGAGIGFLPERKHGRA